MESLNQLKPESAAISSPVPPDGETIHAGFEWVARTYPDRLAVKFNDRTLTYSELNQHANRIARTLVARRGSEPEVVGLLVRDRLGFIEGMFGLFKAGKTYVPLIAEMPQPRLAQIVQDAGMSYLVADSSTLPLARQLLPADSVLNVDEIGAGIETADLNLPVDPGRYALIIFTSGTSGRAKGVFQTHSQYVNRSRVYMRRAMVEGGERATLLGSPAFTASVANIVLGLYSGTTLFPFEIEREGLAGLRDFLIRERITTYSSAASTFRHLLATFDGTESFPDLRAIVLSGEPVLRQDVELFKKYFSPQCVLMVGYASTEAGGVSSMVITKNTPITDDVIPTGRIDPDVHVSIVDEGGKEVAANGVGEIVVTRRFMPSGYWHDPERTARVFSTDPSDPTLGTYRTGDLGRIRPDGMLEHLGRKDFQVKIRGNRVEPSEIEVALRTLEGVREALVIARPDGRGDNRLIAYVVAEMNSSPTARGLRQGLAQKLPSYLLPSAFVFLDSLSLSLGGKISRDGLPEPDWTRESEYVPPGDQVEQDLTRIWENLLQIAPVGIRDNFFDLGGNSLLAMHLLVEMDKTLHKNLPVSVLFEASTIEQLAGLVREANTMQQVNGDSALVPIQARGTRRPFFLVAGGKGGYEELLVYAKLAPYLGTDQPFYGLCARPLPPAGHPKAYLRAMAANHIREITSVQPHGPYLIGGECLGGVVAFEIAQQLRARGEQVGELVLMDTFRRTELLEWHDRYSRFSRTFDWWMAGLRYIPYRARRTAHHISQAARLRGPARREYLAEKTKKAHDLLTRTGEAVDPAPDLQIVPSYWRAIFSYRPDNYPGRIVLLINESWHRLYPDLGWERRARSGVEIHPLAGNHETYIRQNVQGVGECLRDCLARAQT